MATYTALFDACVLYPAPLRDLLISLAHADLFRARWTDQIHDEWIRSVLKNNSHLTPEALNRTRELMNKAVLGCLVSGYEPLIEGLTLPDPDDRHVLAAAIRTRANVIVTFNLKHFPEETLAPFGIEPQHPDDFIISQFELSPAGASAAIKAQRQRLKHPPKSVEEFLQTLAALHLPQTVERLREYAALI